MYFWYFDVFFSFLHFACRCLQLCCVVLCCYNQCHHHHHHHQQNSMEPEGITTTTTTKKKTKMQKKRTNKTTNERKDNKTCKTVKLHLFILTKKNEEERKKNINVMRAKHSFIHSFTNTKKNFLFVRSFVVFDHRR